MSIVEDSSGIGVNNNYVAVKIDFFFMCVFFDMILHNYVLGLGLPSKFVVSNET